MNSRAVFASALVAVNVITLWFMVPLNSIILAQPHEPVCLSCLFTIYGGGMLAVACFLLLVHWGGDKLAVRVQKSLSVLGLVSFLHLVQITTVSPSWRTAYVILCVVVLAPAVIGFLQAERNTTILVHQFFVLLFVYEVFNLGQVILQARALEADIAATHQKREANVVPDKDGHHVFWIIFDEFSLVQSLAEGGDFDIDVVPNLATFSKTSTWYPHARTLSPSTPVAIQTLLSGKKDTTGFSAAFLLNFNSENYLSSIARNMEVFIVGAYLPYCLAFQQVAKGCLDFPSGFSSYRRLAGHVWDRAVPGMLRNSKGGVGVGRLLARQFDPEPALTFALNLGQSFDHPTFTYIHENLPHWPYKFKSDGSVTFLGHDGGASKSLNPDELDELHKSYTEQMTYVDSLFGEFLAQLQARNLYDQSFIVIMSDHGTSFDPRNPGRVTSGHEQVDRVPFLIRSPGQTQGEVDRRSVHTAEFFEILLEQMAQTRGRSSSSHAELS